MVESGWYAEEKVSSALRVTNFLLTALTLAFTIEETKACSHFWDADQQVTSIVFHARDKTDELFKITFDAAENKVSWEAAG